MMTNNPPLPERDALEEFLEAQDALDNHEVSGPNVDDYFTLMRRRNGARKDLDAALAPIADDRAAGQVVDLPDWGWIKTKLENGCPLTPLETFVMNNEPQVDDGVQFRADLQAVVAYLAVAPEVPAQLVQGEPVAWIDLEEWAAGTEPNECVSAREEDKPNDGNVMTALYLAAQPEPIAAEVEALRAAQDREVMPLIGPLLDAWEGTDPDTLSFIKEDAPELAKYLTAINRAMEGAEPIAAEPVAAGDRPQCIGAIKAALNPRGRFKPTPGEWVADAHEGWVHPRTEVRTPESREEGGHPIVRVHADFTCTVGKSEYEWANAAFVAACSPRNMAELLAYVERLELATPAPEVPGQPITEAMHVAACKVLTRAIGLDGTPQRMVDAMLAAAPEAPGTQDGEAL